MSEEEKDTIKPLKMPGFTKALADALDAEERWLHSQRERKPDEKPVLVRRFAVLPVKRKDDGA
jgi:hypothetical protein